MSDGSVGSSPTRGVEHEAAARAFVDRAPSRFSEDIIELYVFGSTVRGETFGIDSDVDVMVVLEDSAMQDTTADELRDLAYDVMLEFGPVVELHLLSNTEFQESLDTGNPFVVSVVQEGRSHA